MSIIQVSQWQVYGDGDSTIYIVPRGGWVSVCSQAKVDVLLAVQTFGTVRRFCASTLSQTKHPRGQTHMLPIPEFQWGSGPILAVLQYQANP